MKRTSKRQIVELMQALGVRAGDTISVAAFIPSLGLVEDSIAGLTSAIQEAIGPEGTLVVPTFTASFRRGETYDVKASPSFNGALSEHVRKQAGAVRSTCGLFAQAAIGPKAGELMRRPSDSCFGVGSVFANLFNANVKLIGLGIDWDQGYSWFMHLERLAEVPFRRDEAFTGTIRQVDGSEGPGRAVHFVRIEEIPWNRDREPVGHELVASGIAREIADAGCAHRLIGSKAVAEALVPRLQRDPWCMAAMRGTP